MVIVDTETGVQVQAKAEVDYSYSGNGVDATTVHAHYRYPVSYRFTDRRVVRAAAEQGPTGRPSAGEFGLSYAPPLTRVGRPRGF